MGCSGFRLTDKKRGETQNKEEGEIGAKCREEGENEMLWESGDIDETVILDHFKDFF